MLLPNDHVSVLYGMLFCSHDVIFGSRLAQQLGQPETGVFFFFFVHILKCSHAFSSQKLHVKVKAVGVFQELSHFVCLYYVSRLLISLFVDFVLGISCLYITVILKYNDIMYRDIQIEPWLY